MSVRQLEAGQQPHDLRRLPIAATWIEVDHHFEELSELDALIERGPDWSTIIQITIRLNPRRAADPDDTVERAAER